MTPEAACYMDTAERALLDARAVLAANVPSQAARLAYQSQFHAAQALIFERTGKISKTHKGVDRQFHNLARGETYFPVGLAAELTRAYSFKENADYGTDPAALATPDEARGAIAVAEKFLAVIRQALTTPPASPTP